MLNPTILSQYLAVLTELVKEESPTLYVEDFLYYYNKAISEYMKLRYEKFGITQQVTDDLRAWIVTYETDSLETNMLELHNNLIAECKEYVQTEIGSKKCTETFTSCDDDILQFEQECLKEVDPNLPEITPPDVKPPLPGSRRCLNECKLDRFVATVCGPDGSSTCKREAEEEFENMTDEEVDAFPDGSPKCIHRCECSANAAQDCVGSVDMVNCINESTQRCRDRFSLSTKCTAECICRKKAAAYCSGSDDIEACIEANLEACLENNTDCNSVSDNNNDSECFDCVDECSQIAETKRIMPVAPCINTCDRDFSTECMAEADRVCEGECEGNCLDLCKKRVLAECKERRKSECIYGCATSRCVELKLEHCKNGTAQKQLKCIQEAEDECVKARSAPYRHLLGCTIAVELVRPVRCCTQKAGKNNIKKYKVTRSTSGRAAGMVDNVYLAPTFHRPYFDIKGNVLTVDVGEIDEKWIKIRTITIDYLRQPSQVTLSELDITAEEDNSQELEFPQDVAEEITKKAVTLILERNRDPRLAQNVSVNQTINDIGLGVK